MTNILDKYNLNNYSKYKYNSEDNTFFTLLYKPLWINMQKLIPTYIHPNIITLLGLFSIVVGYFFKNNTYGNYFLALSIFLYLNFDSVDGIHARKIKQTSIIGEYFDHLIDLINLGIIMDAYLEYNGINDEFKIFKNLLTSTASLIFIIPHYECILIKKIVFKNFTDITTMLTFIIITYIFNIKLPLFLLNNNLFMFIVLLINIYLFYWLFKLYNSYKQNVVIPLLIGSYYILKHSILCIYPLNNIWLITIPDMLLLLQLINYKIFKIKINILIIFIPLLFIYFPTITVLLILNYIIDFILKICNQLNINLFVVIHKPLKVFCCGVFDMCHLGHMVLFEKIYKSFDEPIELIVGIHNDKVCKSYKREPIINEDIRFRTIEHCKYVDKVIKNTPLVITKEYILKNNFDIVIIGEEYKNNKDKEWYPGAFELNKYKYISRFTEISTSDIINKIVTYK
jgi:cytidyltransferase-like protein